MMYQFLIYSLKVGACLAVFWLFFRLLLSRETFHGFNRVVLLGGMAVSFLLPLCVITLRRELPPLSADQLVVPLSVATTPQTGAAFSSKVLAGVLFLTGAVASLLWRLGSLVAVWRLIRRGRRERLDDGAWLIRVSQSVTPFSWGRCIVLPERLGAADETSILLHERAHVRLHHTFDLLLVDLAGCLQWFNPAVWILRRELRQVHEYEADEAVLESGVDPRSYQMLLIKKAVGERWYSVANSLSHSKLKDRIAMMLRKKSSRWAAARALLLLPLVGVALGAFAETRYVVSDERLVNGKREIRIEEGQPAAAEIEGRPLILVDGRRVSTLDSLRPEQIASVTVRKDSLVLSTYGEEAREGVILVTLRRPADEPASDSAALRIGGSRLPGVPASDPATATEPIAESSPVVGSSVLSGNPVILVDGSPFEGDLRTIDPRQIKQVTVYKEAVPEAYRRFVGPENHGIVLVETRRAADSSAETAVASTPVPPAGAVHSDEESPAGVRNGAPVGYNTVLGAAGGMMVTGPEVMSTSRTEDGRWITVARGRVTADFSQIDEADYRIEINGKPATRADLERIEPGKIRRVELIRTHEEPGRQGVVRVRTRK
ncbi:M56 family metallopeptidase [Alistipes sp.]|uniref:M56 family metallopeptidase n=1 Tax=Alistipes sp. TaxID=1872444 RepID=UPI003A8B1396